MPNKSPSLVLLIALLMSASGVTAGCASQESAAHDHPMADLSQMPPEVQGAPILVQQAYQFAVANPETLQQIPCYCGCGAIGHASNYACYVAGAGDDGQPVFDLHALDCSICVDITQDTLRLLRQGKDLPAIQIYLEQSYSRYGPSNLPG